MEEALLLLKTISDVITAGVAIISFSLFIYAITFKLRDRVTWSFTFLLACIVIVFGADAFVTTTYLQEELLIILKIQYIGLIFLPSVYFLFSDALLESTGKLSRGKRRVIGVVSLLIGIVFCIFLFNGKLFSEVITTSLPAPHIERTTTHDLFSGYYLLVMAFSWYNFIRARNRTSTRTSKRRMDYLITSAIGPALGSFPYLLYGSEFASQIGLLFWLLSIFAYLFVAATIIGMMYTVSFLGFPWPDRVIKSRLFRWIMRGPVTASITLGVTTLISRISAQLGADFSSLIVLGMVATIVLFEYLVTIFAPLWERFLFAGSEREELGKVRLLEDKLLTKNDLEQFLELVLATLCDQMQFGGAFLVENREDDSALNIGTGNMRKGFLEDKTSIFTHLNRSKEKSKDISVFEGMCIIPIIDKRSQENNLLGFIVTEQFDYEALEDEKKSSLLKLIDRTAIALQDRKSQDLLLSSLEILTPQVTVIQNILASSRFDQKRIINGIHTSDSKTFERWIKEALTHFFGGPKLSESPLLQLSSVQRRIRKNEESSLKALRAVLKEAIATLRPLGERKYTNEWILYNILELKFIEGWKVKDLSKRLALSEADFYRKQRVAITAVANQIINLEKNDFGGKSSK